MMSIRSIVVMIFAIFGWFACGCSKNNSDTTDPEIPAENDKTTYVNPVFQPVLADPSVIKSGCCFYAYGTEDDWGNEGGYHMVPIVRSDDLVNWVFVANAFVQKPAWKNQSGIWAPDVTEVSGKFYMYYSYSTWGDSNPGIGLAIADHPAGPFSDQGKVFDSNEIGVANSIDPFYIEENGNKYLFWGSFRGLFAVKLSNDGRQVVGEKKQIAFTHLEATYIYKRNEFYYLFGSEGSCCDGENSTYRVLVGRANSLLGPYTDKNGNNLLNGSYGEVLIHGNDGAGGFVGPGHNAEIVTDDEGTDWFIYHAMLKSHARLNNGVNRRSLLIDKLTWKNDWPEITGNQPSVLRQYGPVFKK